MTDKKIVEILDRINRESNESNLTIKPAKKPKCKLVGTDGNVFALAGKVREALKKAGQYDKAKEVSERLFKCASYSDALRMFGEYITIS